MSRARKGLKKPVKKNKTKRVNPRSRFAPDVRPDYYIPGEELSTEDIKYLESIFGPFEGEIKGVYSNL